jgi:hypothetical protein
VCECSYVVCVSVCMCEDTASGAHSQRTVRIHCGRTCDEQQAPRTRVLEQLLERPHDSGARHRERKRLPWEQHDVVQRNKGDVGHLVALLFIGVRSCATSGHISG